MSATVPAGTTLEAVFRVTGEGGNLIREGDVLVLIWSPGSDSSAGDPPFTALPAAWDETRRAWAADIDTTGWSLGTYVSRGEAVTPEGVRAYAPVQSFTLTPV